jgi:hypothetical protein
MLSRPLELSLIITVPLLAISGCSSEEANLEPYKSTTVELNVDSARKENINQRISSIWTYQAPSAHRIALTDKRKICNSFSKYKIAFKPFNEPIESPSGILKSIAGRRLTITWRNKRITLSNGYTIMRSKGLDEGSGERDKAPIPASEFRAMYVHDGSVEIQISENEALYGVLGTLLDPMHQKQGASYDRERVRTLAEVLSPLLYLFIIEFEPDVPGNLNGRTAEFFRTEVSSFGQSYQYYINPTNSLKSRHQFMPQSVASFRELMSSLEIAQMSSGVYAIRYAKSNPTKIALIDEKSSDAIYFICSSSK